MNGYERLCVMRDPNSTLRQRIRVPTFADWLAIALLPVWPVVWAACFGVAFVFTLISYALSALSERAAEFSEAGPLGVATWIVRGGRFGGERRTT